MKCHKRRLLDGSEDGKVVGSDEGMLEGTDEGLLEGSVDGILEGSVSLIVAMSRVTSVCAKMRPFREAFVWNTTFVAHKRMPSKCAPTAT